MNILDGLQKLLPLAGPLATIVAAVYVSRITKLLSDKQAFIALQQSITASNKLKLDLFDKRFEVFTAARRAAEIAMMNANPASPDYDKWPEFLKCYNKTIDGRFLFKPDTYAEIKLLAERADTYISDVYRYQKSEYPGNEKANETTKALITAESALNDSYKRLPEICASELRLDF